MEIMSKFSDKIEVKYVIEEASHGDYKSLINRFGFKKNQIMIKTDARRKT